MGGPEDNPRDDEQPTKEEWEHHENTRDLKRTCQQAAERAADAMIISHDQYQYGTWNEPMEAAIVAEFLPLLQAERERALRNVIKRLRYVADAYFSGGHTHRAQMLGALAKEFEAEADAIALSRERSPAKEPKP